MELWGFLLENSMTFAWLILVILLLLVEVVTVGLTCIWAAGGALVAMILSVLHVSAGLQILAFLIVTAVLLYFTRPFALKVINSKRELTNSESIVGKVIRIAEDVNNIEQTGMAVVNGQEWTVRAEEDSEVFAAGTMVAVVKISGVKLIVKKHEEE